MISLDISELHPLRARCKPRLSLGYTGTCKNPPGAPHPRPEGVTQPPVCSIVVGIRGIPISSRIKRAPLPLWGLTLFSLPPSLPSPSPHQPPGKLSPSLSSAPDGLTSPLFPAACIIALPLSIVVPLSSSPVSSPKSSLCSTREALFRASFSYRFFSRYTRDSIRVPPVGKFSSAIRSWDSGREKSVFRALFSPEIGSILSTLSR